MAGGGFSDASAAGDDSTTVLLAGWVAVAELEVGVEEVADVVEVAEV